MSRLVINETGNRYGRLVVLERAGKSKWGSIVWLCRCDCGNEKEICGASLRKGKTQSCGCLQSIVPRANVLPAEVATMRVMMYAYMAGAKRRFLRFGLTEEQFHELTRRNCYYCGVEPSQIYSRSGYNGSYTYNGLDRVDNDEGYVIDNVVPCCKVCNMAKKDMSQIAFLEWADRIYHHQHR